MNDPANPAEHALCRARRPQKSIFLNNGCLQCTTTCMSKVLGVRLTKNEVALINEAAKLEEQPGDRSGASGCLRRLALREARRVVEAAKAGSK